MRQIITRVDEELADAVKREAGRIGESVNSYITRLLRVAVTGPGSSRHLWKAAALADGRLARREGESPTSRHWALDLGTPVTTPAGYAADLVSGDREER
jgi:hypothetical protein